MNNYYTNQTLINESAQVKWLYFSKSESEVIIQLTLQLLKQTIHAVEGVEFNGNLVFVAPLVACLIDPNSPIRMSWSGLFIYQL